METAMSRMTSALLAVALGSSIYTFSFAILYSKMAMPEAFSVALFCLVASIALALVAGFIVGAIRKGYFLKGFSWAFIFFMLFMTFFPSKYVFDWLNLG